VESWEQGRGWSNSGKTRIFGGGQFVRGHSATDIVGGNCLMDGGRGATGGGGGKGEENPFLGDRVVAKILENRNKLGRNSLQMKIVRKK